MSQNKQSQNAPKHSKSSVQQFEVLRTTRYAFFEKKWNIDDEGLAHLHTNESRDSELIQDLHMLFQESTKGVIEPYWDASGHKRYRHHSGTIVTGIVIDDKTYRFCGDIMSNLMYITHVNNSGQEIWSKEIDLHKHVDFVCYTAHVDYFNLAIELWEIIKADNGK